MILAARSAVVAIDRLLEQVGHTWLLPTDTHVSVFKRGSQRVPKLKFWVQNRTPGIRLNCLILLLEATPGIEPGYAVLQTAA
jgi:hypothetical protein